MFWLSYECFSILCNAFLLKRAISSHNSCENSKVMFTFFCFRLDIPFWVNLVQNIKMVSLSWNGQFELLVRKIKTVSLSGNLTPRLIWICCFQWWCSLFQFLTENTFLGKFGLKNQIVSLSWKLVFRLIRILRVEEFSRDVHLFLFSIRSMLFLEVCSKNQNCVLKLKFRI